MKHYSIILLYPHHNQHTLLFYKVHLNLKSHLADGRQVLTFIRPGTKPGVLLDMVKELPWNHHSAEYLPLSRVAVFSAKDDSLSLNLFVYGEEQSSENFNPAIAGGRILAYAEEVQANKYAQDEGHPKPSPLYEPEVLLKYLEKCSETFLLHSDPRRFLKMLLLYDAVSGTEGTLVGFDVSMVVAEVAVSLCVAFLVYIF